MSNTEPPEYYERMVKEKPVFNPNLAEEMRTVKAEPAQHIPCSTETSTASCTFCGETGITFPHTCSTVEVRYPQPNRFDPYEALDRIEKIVREDDELDRDDADDIMRQLFALRAYITGMER